MSGANPFRPLVSAFTVGALLGAVVLGGGAAQAYFTATATATATGQVTSQTLAITQANFQNLNQTYRNTHSTLTQTGVFTVTNAGQASGQLSVQISSSETFLHYLPIRVWPVASDTNLNAGASVVYCVRTSIDPHTQRPRIATPSGTRSGRSTLTATLSAARWTASTTATNTHKTEGIYPLATGYLWEKRAPYNRYYASICSTRIHAGSRLCSVSDAVYGERTATNKMVSYVPQEWEIDPDDDNESVIRIRSFNWRDIGNN